MAAAGLASEGRQPIFMLCLPKVAAMSKERTPIVFIKPFFLARADAAAFLAIGESTFEDLVARGEAPKTRPNRWRASETSSVQ